MGVRKIDYLVCNGCGTCVKICPMDIFRFDKEIEKALITYLRDCQSCFICARECPQGAIDVMPFFERRMPSSW